MLRLSLVPVLALVRVLAALPWSRLLLGASASTILASCWLHLAVVLGTSLPVAVGSLAAAALALMITGLCHSRLARRAPTPAGDALAALLLLAATAIAPWLMSRVFALGATNLVSAAARPWEVACLAAAVTLFGLGIPWLAIVRLVGGAVLADGGAGSKSILLGGLVGLAAWMLGAAQVAGPWSLAVVMAGIPLALYGVGRLRRSTIDRGTPAAAPALTFECGGTNNEVEAVAAPLAAYCLCAVLLGGLIATLERVAALLVPANAYLTCSLMLAALGGALLAGTRQAGRAALARAALCSAGAVAAVLASMPLAERAVLWMNATVSSTTLLLLLRAVLVGAPVLPVGWGLALLAAAARDRARTARAGWPAMMAGLALAGFALASGGLLPRVDLGGALVTLCWILAAMAVAAWKWPVGLKLPGRARLAAAAVLVLAALAPWFASELNPRRIAKTLFNTNAFLAQRAGLPYELVSAIDESELEFQAPGERGIYTVWRYGVSQLQIRENGIPKGVTSTDPGIFPEYIPESLQVALPLMLHEEPGRALILGMGTGAGLAAGLEFPVPELVCVEADKSLLCVVERLAPTPLRSPKVRVQICEPKLALAADRTEYDVIACAPDHVSLLRSAGSFTREFYALAAARLAEGGIFCQRVSAVDVGPRPLRQVARALQAEFSDVLAMEVTPGEYLFLATNSQRGLVRERLLARVQAPHARRVLAHMGLDWSVVLNLPAYDRAALEQFADESVRAAGSGWALSAPREVMRWGYKLQETQQQLYPVMGRLLNWMGGEADDPDVLRRLSEVKAQQNLMGDYADQYWAYRATLRAQMTNRQRGKIVPAGATDAMPRMHPEDKRRMAYFRALGKAARTREPGDIARIAAFETPYDPLISYFVHHEVAELYRRCGSRMPQEELRHRLHAVFFSSPRDASLGNVVQAITLLRDYPQAQPEARARWQTLNALLQALRQRWEARAGIKPATARAAMADIEATLSAAETALACMQELAPQAGVSPRDFQNRKSVIERMLLKPVRNYRSQLHPHLVRNEQTGLDEPDEAGDKPSAASQDTAPRPPATETPAEDSDEQPGPAVVPAEARAEP